ncbi:aquaporin family protein [Hymenobacter sp. NBH84]|uniref:MIP/aquaporin family protein n=1 Tax=Hymenobacter sp. NBH84 TaxID=2596915 RepID=UPI0016287842|nr:aquaporin [Hymenobacter sp. NBH84]QNE39765.1 aquaporin family protein [Hymenobacter sp. NBH84]
MSTSTSGLLATLRRHWTYYVAEAAGAATFIIVASCAAVVVQHPTSPVRQWLGDNELLRHVVLGLPIGLAVALMTYSAWGQRSGAHLNPAVTLAFWQLGSLSATDTFWYVVFQFAGALTGGFLMEQVLAPWYTHPDIKQNVTVPGDWGVGVALLAEAAISAFFMFVLLWALHSEQRRKYAGWLLAGLLALYIAFETPLSGMSLNPARSLGTAVAAGNFTGLWVYFVAPIASMWLVAVLFQRYYHGATFECAVLAGCATPAEAGPYARQQPQFPDPQGDK